MSKVNAQVVIGVAVLILSAAFLLVGVYFAQLQGLLFQNGANSLQLFANNLAAAKNALYTAPSSMTITLSGNNSLCTWSPAIDAYDCAGGSKVYNISYASGPTLDSGENMFSMAFCVMLTVFPIHGAPAAGEAEDEANSVITNVGAASRALTQLSETDKEFFEMAQTFTKNLNQLTDVAPELGIAEGSDLVSQIGEEEAKNAEPLASDAIQSEQQVQNSFLGTLNKGIQKTSLFLQKHPHIRSLLANIGLYVSSFWLGQLVGSLDSNITNGVQVKDPTIPAFSPAGQLISGQLLSTYVTGEPLTSATDSALNLQVIQYSQLLVSTEDFQNIPMTVQLYNSIQDVVGEAILQQNIINEMAAYSNNVVSNPYATPISGVKVPASLSSPNEFAGSATFSSPSDPLVSMGSFLASKAMLVYGQTASCLGVMPQSVNLNTAFSNSMTVIGSIITPLNFYTKINEVTQLGTYFLGYGGEIYINGQSNGRPTAVGAPVITDQSDLCSIATTSSQPGTNLQTMILPENGGDITLSVSQGLFNTMCSKNNFLFPNTASDFINKILAPSSTSRNISILLPPQYAIGITNSTKSSLVCLYSVAMDANGEPIDTGYSGSFTEYGIPLSCFNVSSMTSGKEHIIFTQGTNPAFLRSEIGKNAFFLNNKSVIGFSIPPASSILPAFTYNFGNGITLSNNFVGNYIPSSKAYGLKVILGVDSPMLNLVPSILHNSYVTGLLNSLQTSILTNVIRDITSFYTPNNQMENYSYYSTEYTNLTFSVQNVSGDLNLSLVSNALIFGVYPNNYNSYGGTYGSGG